MNQLNIKNPIQITMLAAVTAVAINVISMHKEYRDQNVIFNSLNGAFTNIYGVLEKKQAIQDRAYKSANEITSWLRDEGLPIAIIANILKVERKTIYSWIDGGIAKDQNLERLNKVYQLLSNEKQANLRSLYRLWNRETDNRQSLSSLFAENQLRDKHIKETLAKLWPIAKKYMEWDKINLVDKDSKKNPVLTEIREASIHS